MAFLGNFPGPGGVLVIGTGATVPVDGASAVAITPDGKHAYVAGFSTVTGRSVSVIDTATNTVVATVLGVRRAIAITPDGKHAYVANNSPNNVSVIATATNTVVATVPVGGGFIAITPMGNTPMSRGAPFR